MFKYGVFSGPYFSAFGPNTERYFVPLHIPNAGKYGPEKTPYLDTFHAVYIQHFADDANIIYRNKSLRNINQRVNSIYIVEWLRANRIALNTDKSKIVLFRTPRKPLTKKNEF